MIFSVNELEQQWMEWYPKVYGYFYKRVDDKFFVEELTAQTMNAVFTSQKEILNFKAYLWKVAHNYLARYIHLKTATPTVIGFINDEDFYVDQEVETQTSDNYKQKIAIIKESMDLVRLKDVDRQIIQHCIFEERNSTQVAQILNIQPGNVRNRLSRALKKISKKCKELWQQKYQKQKASTNSKHNTNRNSSSSNYNSNYGSSSKDLYDQNQILPNQTFNQKITSEIFNL
jgi:RNA polymerase sigma factor (sigma-70 family)